MQDPVFVNVLMGIFCVCYMEREGCRNVDLHRICLQCR